MERDVELFCRTVMGSMTEIAIRTVLSILFLVASVQKMADMGTFVGTVQRFVGSTDAHVATLAYCVVAFEFIIAAALLVSPLRRAACIGVIVLNSLFIAVLAYAWWRDVATPCGCFGHEFLDFSDPLAASARDLVFISMAMFVYYRGLPKELAAKFSLKRCVGVRCLLPNIAHKRW